MSNSSPLCKNTIFWYCDAISDCPHSYRSTPYRSTFLQEHILKGAPIELFVSTFYRSTLVNQLSSSSKFKKIKQSYEIQVLKNCKMKHKLFLKNHLTGAQFTGAHLTGTSGRSRIFPRGCANSQKCYYFQFFGWKLHEMKEFGPLGGFMSLAPPLDLSMGTHFYSCTPYRSTIYRSIFLQEHTLQEHILPGA